MIIRIMTESDIPVIVDAFAKSKWVAKPASMFEQYLEEQNKGERTCLVAFVDEKFAGYITLKWKSSYPYFAKTEIPEISDLNVLPEFRNLGIGSVLIEKCEKLAITRSDFIGIGVGLYADYGAAQRLYVKRGYIPDGRGITYNYQPVIPGDQYLVDDDLVLWFIKKLSK